jgi:hypothetical protein
LTGSTDQSDCTDPFELIHNTDGSVNLVRNGITLHSRHNPEREAKRFAISVSDQLHQRNIKSKSILLIGVGWGYHIPYICKLCSECTIYIFEPIPEILKILKESGRIEALHLSNLVWIDNPDAVNHLHPLTMVLPVYGRIFRRRLASILSPSGGIDTTTASRFARIWFRNFFKRVSDRKGLPYLVRIDHDSPTPPAALYCGAGPHLIDEIAPLIQSNRHPIFLIASDTALAPLQAAGLHPDIVISMDAGYGTYEHLNAFLKSRNSPNGLPGDTPFLTWTGGPASLETLNANILLYPTTFPLDQLIEPLVRQPAWINPSRNQAGIALHIAARAGCAKLFTAGADFVASDGADTHTGGTGYTLYAMKRLDRTHPLEGYRVRGYGRHLTEKNRSARTGLNDLSTELHIPVLPVSKNGDDFILSSRGDDLNIRFLVNEIPTGQIREYILHNIDRIDYRTIEDSGVRGAEAFIHRYRRIMDRN